MLNALDYLTWRGDLDFAADPVNEIDLFLFSQLATPDYTDILTEERMGLPLSEVIARYFVLHPDDGESLGLLQSKFVLPMLKKLETSPRFMDVVLCRYELKLDHGSSEQFQAVTMLLPTHEMVVSYRGTDDTIIGWKEDCNMAVLEKIPAQQDALEYLEETAGAFPGRRIYTVGHSKGGNLALYAPVMTDKELRKRIAFAYSFDGPGFRDEFLHEAGYKEMKSRMVTVLSQYSVIGMLLTLAGERVVVRSSVKGLYAHDGFYWEAEGKAFVREKKLSGDSLAIERTMKKTLAGLDTAERQRFLDDLFGALLSTGAVTLTELNGMDLRTRLDLFGKIGGAPAIRNFVRMLFENFLKADKQA